MSRQLWNSLGLFVASLVLFVASPLLAKVQCNCPTIKALGEGNTSCSAHESGGQCAIDFNLFAPEDEKNAAELWMKILGGSRTFGFVVVDNSVTLQALAQSNPNALVDTLLTYLAVAMVQIVPRAKVPEDSLRAVAEALRQGAGSVAQRFRPGASKDLGDNQLHALAESGKITEVLNPTHIPPSGGEMRAIVTIGCVEIIGSGFWVMYKANWSTARRLPQCMPR